MGSYLSKVAFLVQRFRILYNLHTIAYRRVAQDPGLPRVDPTIPYWAYSAKKPDVVIIGSGITGTSVARSLLKHLGGESKVKIVMLEAREVCSGATARNGGHITPSWYQDYQELVEIHGKDGAHSQCRLVDTFDVYADPTLFDAALQNYNAYIKELAPFHNTSRIFSTKEQIECLQLDGAKVSGVIGMVAGAAHPYRLVTGILSNLLRRHNNFELFALTPCTSITSSPSAYIVSTPKGTISAKHVVHATNAWTSHLLPEFRQKVVPIRGQMSSQRPGTDLGLGSIPEDSFNGSRSFILYADGHDRHYNYLTQQPPSAQSSNSLYPPPQGELMLGGCLAIMHDVLLRQMGNSDDTKTDPAIDTYLSGILPSYWGKNWGDESRVKATWTGVLGWSVDGRPWVGRVPPEIIGRRVNAPANETGLVQSGEWLCAGYTGEGMVNAWRCGDALSHMILGKSDYQAWLPDSYAISLQRHRKNQSR
ncbi:FAD dependent oxidoreductase [Flagelloscypha sp. PMI_526]|nr:FAD dependent oxidoreductase [Flagelloscypha sp. PMI_526]